MDGPAPNAAADTSPLVQLLDLRTLEPDLHEGGSIDVGGRSVFGGQVVAQALVAAQRSMADEREPHSLHAYFLQAGDLRQPIRYAVERLRDGRSFSARRVQALQNGRPILSMIASFQRPEDGFEHSIEMPDTPSPERLRPVTELRDDWLREVPDLNPFIKTLLQRDFPVEFRPVQRWNPLRPQYDEPRHSVWFRMLGNIPEDAGLHRALLAYASDFYLLSCTVRPHGQAWYAPELMAASLDHALWFHRPARVDEWLLYSMESPIARSARGLATGRIWDREGRLIASVAQEGLIRRFGGEGAWERGG
jgi:acyl-CoA thioesterase-2